MQGATAYQASFRDDAQSPPVLVFPFLAPVDFAAVQPLNTVLFVACGRSLQLSKQS